MMKFFVVLLAILISRSAMAVTNPSTFVYEGVMTDTVGNPINLTSVVITYDVMAGSCVIFSETATDGTSTGQIAHLVGSGTLVYNNAGANTLPKVFSSTVNLTGVGPCTATPTTPRTLRVTVATSPSVTASVQIQAVPYALQAASLEGIDSSSCGVGLTLKWNGSNYYCATDDTLDASVQSFARTALPNCGSQILTSNGSALSCVAAATGTITGVTPGTGLTGGGVSGSVSLGLSNVGTAGTYTKVTTDATGRVTGGTTLVAADIPSLNAGQIGSGVLGTSVGGTGKSSYAVGDLLYASSTNVLSSLSAGTSGYVLTSNGPGTAPSWAAGGGGGLPAAMGSAPSPSYAFVGNTTTGMFSPAASMIGFSVGGAEKMRILPSGNVGIGNTSPTYPLHVSSTTTSIYGNTTSGTTTDAGVTGYNSSFGAGVYGQSDNGSGVLATSTFGSNPNAAILATHFGIGPAVQANSTSGPSGLFQSGAAGNTNPTLITRQASASTADLFQAQNSSSTSLFRILYNGQASLSGALTTGGLSVTGSGTFNNTSSSIYTATGTGQYPNGPSLFMNNPSLTTGASEGQIFSVFNAGATNQNAYIAATSTSSGFSPALVFGRQSAVSTYAESMRIDNFGNVGIGTTSPGAPLDVKGAIRMSGLTSGYTGFQPAAAAGSTVWTLPSTDGTSNQVLTTNGAGILSWSTPSGGGGVASVTASAPFTSSGGTNPNISLSGTIPLASGGTGANLVPNNGGIVYSGISTMGIVSGTATAGLPLISGASTTPSWSTVNLSGGNIVLPASGTISNASGPMTVNAVTNLNLNAANNVTVSPTGTGLTTLGSSLAGSATLVTSGSTGGITLNPNGSNLTVTGWTSGLIKSNGSGVLGTASLSDLISTLGYTPVNKAGDTMTGPLVNTSNSSTTALAVSQAGSGAAATFMGGKVGFGTLTPGYAIDVVSSTASNAGRMRILQSNNSDQPTIELTGYSTTNIAPQLVFTASDGTSGAPVAITSGRQLGTIGSYGYTGSGVLQGGMINFIAEGAFAASSAPTGIAFLTAPNGSGIAQERLRISNTGNIGIGTASPANKLQVAGEAWIEKGPLDAGLTVNNTNGGIKGVFRTEYSAGNSAILVGSPADSNTDVKLMSWGITKVRLKGGGTGIGPVVVGAAYADVDTQAYSNADNGLIVSGNVGIGTPSPGYKLHVVGTAGLSSGTSWTNASDIRLKDIQGDYTKGLDEVLQLRTVIYNYKKDNALNLPSDLQKTGFIAQDVQKVIPEAVNTRKDGYLEINVDPIHWAVVNAIKDMFNKYIVPLSNSDQLQDREISSIKEENILLKKELCRKDPTYSFCNK